MRKTHTQAREKSKRGLTRHTTAMHLMIQAPGHGVVPRQRFGPIPQLFVGAVSEEGAQTFLAHREVMQDL